MLTRSATSAMNFLIQLKRKVITERHFRTKLKRNLTSAIEISHRNANTAFFAILDRKRVNNLLKEGRHLAILRSQWNKISLMYRIAL